MEKMDIRRIIGPNLRSGHCSVSCIAFPTQSGQTESFLGAQVVEPLLCLVWFGPLDHQGCVFAGVSYIYGDSVSIPVDVIIVGVLALYSIYYAVAYFLAGHWIVDHFQRWVFSGLGSHVNFSFFGQFPRPIYLHTFIPT